MSPKQAHREADPDVRAAVLTLSSDNTSFMLSRHMNSKARSIRRVDPEHQVLKLMQDAVARISAHVQVELSAETVLLSGRVEFWHQKQYAQESIRELSSASGRIISNHVSVENHR